MPPRNFYIGVKLIEAYPETKDGKHGYHVTYPDGYESWSPKDVFEKAYLCLNDEAEDFLGDHKDFVMKWAEEGHS